jgi:phage-related protein
MINSDLSNIKKWSEDWLITFNNPDKTDIMLFESRRQGNLNFKFGQTDILSVDFHKHLGIVFSSDVNGHDILTTYYLKHPSMYVFYEN